MLLLDQELKRLSAMLPHLRPHIFSIVLILVAALLLTPPLSMAKNLPTACNFFNKKTTEKPGSCGHRAMVSKIQDKGFELEAISPGQLDLGPGQFIFFPTIPSSFTCFLEGIALSNPLRC